jgi:hypothetical protein
MVLLAPEIKAKEKNYQFIKHLNIGTIPCNLAKNSATKI